MKKGKILVITGIVLIIAVLVIFATNGRRGHRAELVKTTQATTGEIRSILSTNAVVKSKSSKSYTGSAQFTIKKVNVKLGDSVKKGQVLLEYDLTDLSTSVAQAEIQYSNAVLQRDELLKQKKKIDDSIQDLDEQIKQLEGSQNPAELTQLQGLKQKRDALQPISKEKLEMTDNSVDLAKLSLDSAKSKYDKLKGGIVADFDGVVTALNAVEGATLSPSQPAAIVQQLDNLKAIISLGKYDAAKVRVGQEVTIKNGSDIYKGKVSFINPAAKSLSAGGQETNLEAEIDILDKDTSLIVDFDVNADILIGSVQGAVKIPVECIKYDKGNKSYVFTLEDHKAKQVEVKLGLQSDTEAQVLEGLSSGDTIIQNPGISIKDGTPVRTKV